VQNSGSNPFVEPQLPKGMIYLSKASNRCDCGTVLGSIYYSFEIEFHVNKKEIQKLKRKGWSQSKIQRWLDEKEKYKNKLKRESATYEQYYAPQANKWFEFIKSVVLDPNFGKLGLLLHMYIAGPETEKVTLISIKEVEINNIKYDFLMKLQEDILYQFTK
jgi:hypothetical protein